MSAAVRWTVVTILGAAACRDPVDVREAAHRALPVDGIAVGRSDHGARPITTIGGFNDPESVRYDPDQDVIFVSNIAGFGSLRDGNGYISRIPASTLSPVETFVAGGVNGVTLHAPKGMTIQGDTLWVTDIDVVRGFHRRTGTPVGTIDFTAHRPVMLNDIAAGPDGTMRVTDTGIHMVYEGNIHTGPDRIFAVGAGRTVTVADQGLHLRQPNGIAWDSATSRWLFVSFDPFVGQVAHVGGDTARPPVHRSSPRLDGLEPLPDGALLVSSWKDSSIHVLSRERDVRVIREMPEPADIGLDTRRGRVLVPLTVLGQVQVWDLGPWWRPRER